MKISKTISALEILLLITSQMQAKNKDIIPIEVNKLNDRILFIKTTEIIFAFIMAVYIQMAEVAIRTKIFTEMISIININDRHKGLNRTFHLKRR